MVFVCRANGGRSAISRVLTEHYAQGRVVAVSAGTDPGEHIHPEVATALEALGLDASREVPKKVTTEMVAASDVAITMGCGDACPIFPGKRYEDWELEDPAGKNIDTVRRVRDDIRGRVENLIGELLPTGS